ncbi:PilL N-terminal domain-containing protein [Avibacterium sp. 20-15]|uniref:PFGI-1 class ICE element type IV pilus protein PilL2 n=1 Tax=unclassified Avibacterium TaxID=2685287 RepID=UPI002026B72A|nr:MULTISPECIES: PilL N-terminal domain-containing protein [unclassified Avibacterium]MCW9734201.1 PilL N-terminal domain-containing protein [Avibacterium sp. 20-15]URL03624.1 PilL N-terminal domain-containing protein [Avibacterium sp. 20-132]URL03836.1 PilL N-terminal domain-containing protein [Avibacterium sp. 20-132]
MKKSYFSLLIIGCVSVTMLGCVQHPQQGLSTATETQGFPEPEVVIGQNTSPPSVKFEQVIVPDIYQSLDESKTQIIRQGRYTLVNTSPEEGQKYLLEQMVTVNMLPKKKNLNVVTVEQGLTRTLSGTGLRLCAGSHFNQTASLFSLPLPKVHRQFGPIKLREALQMLAGPAYAMTLNAFNRTVCFTPRDKPIDVETKRVEIISTTTETEVINE